MKLAIHHRKGSFSDRWIEYCKLNKIDFKIVNAYDTNIIQQVKDCDAFMWHHHHANYKDVLAAKPILFALEHIGIKVFPNFKTAWHFDDKVAQKYLLESLRVPLVPSYVFYDKKKAMEWAKNVKYPIVFKLKGGAGSANVKLVKNKRESNRLIKIAFNKGFSQFNRWGYLKERFNKFKKGKESFLEVCKGLVRLIWPVEFARFQSNSKGYIYFQDFIPNNDFDIRVVIVEGRAFALKRLVRRGDFRASGSGEIRYEMNEININCVKLSFDVNDFIQSQCIAFDFIFDENENPIIVELSYGFDASAYDNCEGYWTADLKFHKEKFNPQVWMLESVINKVNYST